MDESPFLVFDLLDSTIQIGEMMKLFTKQSFDREMITSIAIELKYTSLIKQLIIDEMKQPSEILVRHFASQVYSGPLSPARQTQFADIIQQAWQDLIGVPSVPGATAVPPAALPVEKVAAPPSPPRWPRNGASASAPAADRPITPGATNGSRPVTASSPKTSSVFPDTKTILADPGLEAFRIIREIAQSVVGSKHVLMRDGQGYCYLVHNNGSRRRVAICRLYLNGASKMIGLFDEHQQEHQFALQSIEDLHQYAQQLRAIVRYYDQMLEMA
jgi:hypothetical protein